MERYKRVYIERYKISDSWLKEIEEKESEMIKTNNFYTFSSFPIREAVIRVNEYSKLLLKILDDLYKDYFNKEYNEKQIISGLNIIFKTYNITFILKKYDEENDKKKSGINEGISSPAKDNIVPIRIECNTFISNIFSDNYNNLRQQFEYVINHELIHRGQFLKIVDEDLRLKVLKNQIKTKSYMERYSEIMAYANSIIDELRFDGNTDDDILKIVKGSELGKSGVLDNYIEFFKIKEDKPEVLHKLYKYVYEYLKGKK